LRGAGVEKANKRTVEILGKLILSEFEWEFGCKTYTGTP
jgi:hypothetical protein